MRNILIFITTLNPGGAERIVWELARGLAGYNVTVAALDGSGEYAVRLRSAGIEVHDLRCSGIAALPKAVYRLRKLLKSLKIDLLNTHLFHAGIVGRFAAAATGIPVIGTCHIAERRSSQKYRFMVERLTHRLANGEICVSKHVAEFQSKNTGISRDYFHVVPNGIDLNVFKPATDRKTLRIENGVDPDACVIGFLGRFDYQKGADRFVQMMNLFKPAESNVEKLIAGYGVMQDELETLADDTIRFCGY